MNEFDALHGDIPSDLAREALMAVTDGRGLFTRNDGPVRLSRAAVDVLKKYPPPTTDFYDDYRNWALEVDLRIEKTHRKGKAM